MQQALAYLLQPLVPRQRNVQRQRCGPCQFCRDQVCDLLGPPVAGIIHRFPGQGRDQFAEQRADRQDLDLGGCRRGDVKRSHLEIAPDIDLVGNARRHEQRPIGRHDPGVYPRFDAHHARSGIDELVALMAVQRDARAVGEPLRHDGQGRREKLIIPWVCAVGHRAVRISTIMVHTSIMRLRHSGINTCGAQMMTRDTRYFLLLNVGHFLDHYFMLIFATVAALALSAGWGMSYAELLPYGAPGFAAFALCALPMGILADRWGRDRMMVVFFAGIGLSSILTGFAQTPLHLGAGLLLIGIFGSIYHPVGLAIVTARWKKTGMRLAVNGIWGNLGVGCAALVTGVMIDLTGWRAAFFVPGVVSILFALPYALVAREVQDLPPVGGAAAGRPASYGPLWRVLLCVYMTAVLGSIVFQSMTVALPEIFEERLAGLADAISAAFASMQITSASVIGALAFLVFAAASLAQLVTGHMLDRFGARPTLALVAGVQMAAFLLMPGLTDLAAFAVAFAIMLGVFGQVPVNDFLIGTTASKLSRSRAFGARYLVSFLAFSGALPLIAIIQANWGFDGLFRVLMICPALIFIGSRVLLSKPSAAFPEKAGTDPIIRAEASS